MISIVEVRAGPVAGLAEYFMAIRLDLHPNAQINILGKGPLAAVALVIMAAAAVIWNVAAVADNRMATLVWYKI